MHLSLRKWGRMSLRALSAARGCFGRRRANTSRVRQVGCPVAAPAVAAEALEDRQLLSTVYVSTSTGRDGNSGLSSGAAVRSLARAKSLVHSGDTLLLKAGDTWGESFG